MKNFSQLKNIAFALLLVAISSNKLQSQNVTANAVISGNSAASAKSIAFQKMHLGLFVHYTYVGKPYQWGSTLWADTSKVKSLDELADNLDVNDLAAMAASMRAQYVVFTAFHANMNVLCPSVVMKRQLPGHCSKRDVIGDLIKALKAKNIRLLLYFHPSDGHDFTKEDQERVGWNDGAPFTRWNDFINEFLE